jgi:hypothetical protein
MNVMGAVNNVVGDDSVNNRQPLRSVNRLSAQQQRILELAAWPAGVSSHEAVVAIGGERIRVRPHKFYWNGSHPRIVGTPSSRSVAASVSRSISRLHHLGLVVGRWHLPYRDAEQRMVRGEWRYHATAGE